jgi:hypothetical protein
MPTCKKYYENYKNVLLSNEIYQQKQNDFYVMYEYIHYLLAENHTHTHTHVHTQVKHTGMTFHSLLKMRSCGFIYVDILPLF